MLELFFKTTGRLRRRDYWCAVLGTWLAFAVTFSAVESLSATLALALYPPFLWILFALTSKRLHDLNRSAMWMLLLAVPLVGIVWLGFTTLGRRGEVLSNRYGDDPRSAGLDYFTVDIHRRDQQP